MQLNIMSSIPEIETPVGQPEISGASLTSHLVPRHYLDHPDEAHEAAEEMRAEISKHSQGLALPATLAGSLALNAQIRAETPADRRFLVIKADRLRKLAAHIHTLSQGPSTVPIDHKTFWKRPPAASALARNAARMETMLKTKKV
jgi:hypothetical protein